MSLLLALGANPQDREQGTGNTALFYAVMTDNQAGVRKLLELGLDINGVNDKGETPLFVAGRQNLWKMSLFLLLVPLPIPTRTRTTAHAHAHATRHAHAHAHAPPPHVHSFVRKTVRRESACDQ
jgi:ABC-type nickel/cobalt efflux system permease component RcnA